LAGGSRETTTSSGRARAPDLTSGPIGPTLVAFALPVMGANIVQTLNGSVNTAWVSHILGPAALAATANAGQIFFLMIGVVFGISMAANILIGHAIGARDDAAARRAVGTCTTFFVVVSLALALLGWMLTPHILAALGTPVDARPGAIRYLRILFAAMPSVYFFNFVMMAQRGVGDSRTPFYFALMQVGLDIVLNPPLIIGLGPFPRLGIAGSATATLISQSLTLVVMLVHLYRRHSILVVRPAERRLLVPDLAIVRALVFKGMPMGIQMIVISLAGLTMMRLVNQYGSQTSAAYGAAMQLWNYVQMPAMAISAAVSSMAAQNVGAGRMDRVERVAWIGASYALVSSLVPILAVLATQHWVLMAFLPASSPVLPIAERINLLAIWSFIPFGVAYAISGVVRATGAVWPPLLAMVVALWFVRIPFAFAMIPHWGSDAVWASFPVGSMVTLTIALAYYRWGGWRKARLLHARPQGETPDPGQGPSSGVEESEVQAEVADGLSRSAPSGPRRPKSEAPVG
jgi:putative MATE family efflux protein